MLLKFHSLQAQKLHAQFKNCQVSRKKIPRSWTLRNGVLELLAALCRLNRKAAAPTLKISNEQKETAHSIHSCDLLLH
jgi:hypothetical protein